MSELIITFLASYLFVGVLLSLGLWWAIDGLKDKEMIVAAVLAGVLAWFLVFVLKDILDMPRPFMVNNGKVLTMTVPWDGAFPSGHMALLFALSTVVFFRNRRWGLVYMVAAAAVGVGRVIANVHYPMDILGGAVIGVVVGVMVSRFNLMSFVRKLLGKKS